MGFRFASGLLVLYYISTLLKLTQAGDLSRYQRGSPRRDVHAQQQLPSHQNSAQTAAEIANLESFLSTFMQWIDEWIASLMHTESFSPATTGSPHLATTLYRSDGGGSLDASTARPMVSDPRTLPLHATGISSVLSLSPHRSSTGATIPTSSSLRVSLSSSRTHLQSHGHTHASSRSLGLSSPSSTIESGSDSTQTIITRTTTVRSTIHVTRTTTITISRTTDLLTPGSISSSSSAAHSPSVTNTFDASATTNIAVYYGQDPESSVNGLVSLCSNPHISIVNLAFVPDFFSLGGYPVSSFGPACSFPQNQAQSVTGLQNCTLLGRQIQQCQSYGKKILVSLGGYNAQSSFPSPSAARQFASTLWNLFGAGSEGDQSLRPFGPDVVVDGFDIDNEDHLTTFWSNFAKALLELYSRVPSRKFFLSAAPQCPRPDESIPISVLRMCDFVHVQFYNNPSCNLDSAGFLDSLSAWSRELRTSTAAIKPRLFVGMPAWIEGGTGYLPGQDLAGALYSKQEMRSKVPNLGGIMFWAGPEALSNVDNRGKNMIDYAAVALASG